MGSQPATRGCCSGLDEPEGLDASQRLRASAELGRRRLLALRWVAAVAGVALFAAALLPLDPGVGRRLAIAAAVLGVPRLLGVLRRLLLDRRASLPTAVALALVIAALAGLWLVVAAAVAIVLVADLAGRRSAAAIPTPSAAPNVTGG
jgi:hypothetical protein